MAAIQASGLSKTFKGAKRRAPVEAVRAISFSVEAGECLEGAVTFRLGLHRYSSGALWTRA
ncbi:MAG: hypothetical protein ABR529_11895 [Actinomycetota bacterium]